MTDTLTGNAWCFGDGINTDLITPGIYMQEPLQELSKHCLEGVNASFAKSVKTNDFVIAGKNFGIGSSREQAAEVLQYLGVGAVIALSFGGIFYRNAFNWGLPAITCRSIDGIKDGHKLEVVIKKGTIFNTETGVITEGDPTPPHLSNLIDAGGLVSFLENNLKT